MIDIREVIELRRGISTLENYDEYKKKISKTPVSLNEIEELSPDNIDSGEFWKYCDNNPEFKYDAIAFGIKKNQTADACNDKNFMVAAESGVFSRILMYRKYSFNVLDIGAGFGMLKNELANYVPHAKYYGVDVHPKFDGVIKIKDCILPPEIMEKEFDFVFGFNVFQHLSLRQRRTYYEQVARICTGYFVLTNCVNSEYRWGYRCVDNDKLYMCHYGQFTEIQPLPELLDDLKKYFVVASIQQRTADDHYCFHLRSKRVL